MLQFSLVWSLRGRIRALRSLGRVPYLPQRALKYGSRRKGPCNKPKKGLVGFNIGVGITTNGIPLWPLCNYTIITPKILFYF